MTVTIHILVKAHDCKCTSGIYSEPIALGVKVVFTRITFTLHMYIRSMMDMKRDGYRDQIVTMSV